MMLEPRSSGDYSERQVEAARRVVSGAKNTVALRVASLSDFIIMKSHAVHGRDKPKDVYDLVFCLDRYPGGLESLARDWRVRLSDPLVDEAIRILREKFATIDHFGSRQIAEFYRESSDDERAMETRRAFELVQTLLRLV